MILGNCLVPIQPPSAPADCISVLLDLPLDLSPGTFWSEKTLKILSWPLMRFFVCSETFNHQLVIPFFCTIFPAKWSKTSGFWSMPWSYLCCTEVWCLPYFFYLYKELNSATLPARSHLDFCWLMCLFLWTLWPLQHRFLCWPLPFFTEEFFSPVSHIFYIVYSCSLFGKVS